MSQQQQKKKSMSMSPQQLRIIETLSNLNIYSNQQKEIQGNETQFITELNDLAEKFCKIYEKEKDKKIFKLLKKYYLAAVCKCIKTTNAQKLKKVKDRTKQLTEKGIQGVKLAGSSAAGLASKASSGAVGLASKASSGAVTLGSKGLSGAVTLGSKGLSGAVDLGSKVGGMISSKVRSLTKSQKCDVMNSKILLAVLQGKSLNDITSSLDVTNQVVKQALQTKSDSSIDKYESFYDSYFLLPGDDTFQEKGFQMTNIMRNKTQRGTEIRDHKYSDGTQGKESMI
tara:strand:+ start:708 stop:1559 length:852 start_codon:yes stop_codon:yes gene_type:complete